MKYLKYIGIVIAVILTFYAKNQMDTRNKADIQTMDSLDQDDGAAQTPVKTKK